MVDINFLQQMDSLKNVNEARVWEIMADYFENTEHIPGCLCNICLVDIAAITLNSIPPHYQVQEENIDSAKNKVPDVEIFRQLKKAITLVSQRPHH